MVEIFHKGGLDKKKMEGVMTLKETMLPNSDEDFFASEILVVISLDFISAKEKTIANIFTE